MGKIETVRFVGAAMNEDANGWARGRPELLELLAGGDPAAFATDSRDRVVFWNSGAAAFFGRRADEAIGRHCYEAVGGRDVFGNRFCYPNCPVMTMSRHGESVCGFELRVGTVNGNGHVHPSSVQVTIIRIPGPRPDLFTLVHILQPIDEAARLARVLAQISRPEKGLPVEVPVPAPKAPAPTAASATASATAPASLTAREREILNCIAAGLQNKEIAQKLELSVATVRNHIHNTLEKLGVHSKLEAVSLAFRSGWVSEDGQGLQDR